VKYIRLTARIVIALAFAAIAFVIGTYLPLSVDWLIRGDPGMPGGAALVMLGMPLGVVGAILAGLFLFVKFPVWKQNSK
jgi:hypothetical protein